jgi:hypothetical protein
MISQTPDLATVVERLEKVERQNWRLRGAGIAVLLLAVAGLLMGQGNAEGADSGGGGVCP